MINLIEDFFRKLFGLTKLERFDKGINFKELLNSGATVLDVRTIDEYNEGRIENSIHIPIEELKERIQELDSISTPILAHCRSGRRSGRARKILNKAGIKTYNAGGYRCLIKKI